MRATARGNLRPEAPAAPKAKTVKITKQQLAGIQMRQQHVEMAQVNLNNFLSGIVAGHGYDQVQTTAYDDKKLTLSFVPVASQPAEAKV